jgi:cytochrome c-type biogenesis protein CcmH
MGLLMAFCLGAMAQKPANQAVSQGDMTASGPGQVSSSAPRVPASNPEVQKLGNQLMCMCGCNQILIECDHQGTDRCVMHDQMLAELEQRVASGEKPSLILQSFVQEYGPQVLVVPPAKGFDLTAWLMPIFVGLLGLTLAVLVVQRWRSRGLEPAPAGAPAANVRVRPEHIARARAESEKEDF